jgi:MFS-type transporter involved in bile tolerance (Atg22 family)
MKIAGGAGVVGNISIATGPFAGVEGVLLGFADTSTSNPTGAVSFNGFNCAGSSSAPSLCVSVPYIGRAVDSASAAQCANLAATLAPASASGASNSEDDEEPDSEAKKTAAIAGLAVAVGLLLSALVGVVIGVVCSRRAPRAPHGGASTVLNPLPFTSAGAP